MMAQTTDEASLSVTAQVSGDTLLVNYALVNSGAEPLIAFDGAGGTGDDQPADLTGQLYVSSGGAGVARILRIRPPAHPTKKTTRIFVPAVSEVKPGQTRRVTFRVMLPLKERSEYTPDFAGAVYQQRQVSRIELCVDYFRKTLLTELKPLGKPGVYQVAKGLAPLSDTRRLSATAAASFPLLVRTDNTFIRF